MSDVESGRQMAFEWSNLSVAVPVKRKAHDAKVASGGGGGNPTQSSKSTRQILKPTSGLVSSGDVLAIMGPSGSGKTTLLDALAGRMKLSCVSGSVTFDGKALTEEERRMHVSYVAQEDSLMGVFTVRETVRMAVRFYHGYGLSGDDLEALESKVLTTVGLTSAANTIVGDIFRKGLSGGQKRRLSLAVELVKEPKVLILDEPTSGLDSASAFGIMTSMTSLAKLGHTILCTIHQPSSDIWAVFDKFLLLSEGSTLYFGKAAEAVNYFGALGHPCPQHCNPADFFLGLVNTDFPLHSADLSKLEKAFSKSTHIATDSSTPSNGAMLTSAGPKRTKACGPFADFCTLSRRNILNNLRNPGIFWVRFVMYAMLSLMIGLMYRGLGDDKSGSAITSRISVLFFVAAFLVFMSVAVLPFFIIERATFLRERGNGSYGVPAFVLSQIACAIPGIFLIALVSTALIVPLAGLNGFGVYLAALTAALFTAEGFMCFIGACVPHFIIGIALGAGAFGFFMLCEGFFIVKDDIPVYFIWGHYMAFHTYVFRGFMANEFENIDAFDEGAPFANGKQVLAFYSMDDVAIGRDLGIVVAFGGLFFVLYALVLQVFHTGKR